MKPALAYSIADITKLTGLGRTTLYKAIKSGALQTRKLGTRTLVLGNDLDEFLRALPTCDQKPEKSGRQT